MENGKKRDGLGSRIICQSKWIKFSSPLPLLYLLPKASKRRKENGK
jgi:hypothetical protein